MPRIRHIPGVYYRPEPDVFAQLDDFINGDPDGAAAFLSALVSTDEGRADQDFAFLTVDSGSRTHWAKDWVNATGNGGTYWPYLTDVGIVAMLTRALRNSVEIALGGKQHVTSWLPYLPVPTESIGATEQAALFSALVYEGSDCVSLVIITPDVPE
jgi:hypothetical protein